MSAETVQRELDAAAESYDPSVNDYDLAADPRCLWGWKSDSAWYGHACFRALGHPGRCVDGDARSQRPKDWDTHGRQEANR